MAHPHVAGQKVEPLRRALSPGMTVDALQSVLRALADAGGIECRDACGAGRQSVIHVLEFLDRLGITQRAGDVRRLVRDYVPIFGAGLPATAPPGPVADAAPFLETRQL